MRYIQTVLKSFAASGLPAFATALLLHAAAGLTLAGLTLAGCQRVEPEEQGGEGGGEFIVTATIADEDETKLSLVEDGNDLHPRWAAGDNVLGWDASGATYGLTVSRIVDEGRSAVMNLVTSGSNAGTVTSSSSIADGTLIHLVYAPGLTPSSVSDKTLTYDLATQSASTVPALMTASATVRTSGGKATMSAVFHNRVAILAIRQPVMGDVARTYTSIKVSGPTTTTLNTKISFSISQGGLKAEYGTGGVITKAVSFTSNSTGLAPEATTCCIAICPQTVALTLSTDNCELSGVDSRTYTAGHYHYIQSPVFGHPWVEIGGVKWATMNVGATTIAGEYATCAGDWFAWGATEPWYGTATWAADNARSVTLSDWKDGKSDGYVEANGQYYSGSGYTKYNYTDGLTTLDAADDAATANWGGGWRMPTEAEFEALIAACGGSKTDVGVGTTMSSKTTKGIYLCSSWEVSSGGVSGYLYVADADHKVFFPSAGYFYSGSTYLGGTYCWTSNFTGTFVRSFEANGISNRNSRHIGFTVRPVVNELTRYNHDDIDNVPEGALPGVFTIAAGGLLGSPIRVRFSKGNLYWNGSAFKFEDNQYSCLASWNASHVGNFYWTNTAAKAYAQSYSSGSPFFANGSDANHMITVDGVGNWYVLSYDQLNYLLNGRTTVSSRYKRNVTVCGVSGCLVLAPDDYSGTIASSYDAAAWSVAESSGLVCLPHSGYRNGTSFSNTGYGYYWTSTPNSNGTQAVNLRFNYGSTFDFRWDAYRKWARSIRLVINVD